MTLLLGVLVVCAPGAVRAAEPFGFEDADIATVVKHVSRLTGIMWIVPAERLTPEAVTVKLVTFDHASAGEVAYTLRWIPPPGVRIIPYYPTNSVIISGPPAAVEKLIDIVK